MIALRQAQGADWTGSGRSLDRLKATFNSSRRRFDCSRLILGRVAAAGWGLHSQIASNCCGRSRWNTVDAG
jgi:hypothetical protein